MHLPESLGKILKRTRESKNLSIEDVSERSRIPKHIVSMLEEDRLGEIKSVFYAKSFIKTYAAFLGVLDEVSVKEYLAKGGREQQKKPEAVLNPRVKQNEVQQMDFSIVIKYKKQILAVIIGILVFWAIVFSIGQVTKFIKSIPVKKQSKAVKRTPSYHKGTGQTERQSTKAPVKEKKEESNEKSDSVELEVFALADTWLQVIGDGDMLFTGSFKKGGKDTWKARKEIKLEAGNSGVIKINVNGKPASFSGKKGEKKEIIITKDGIKN